ncbi:MAG: hypothetical protein ACLPKB_15005, partial [Xanthobacteraceae bacterium]
PGNLIQDGTETGLDKDGKGSMKLLEIKFERITNTGTYVTFELKEGKKSVVRSGDIEVVCADGYFAMRQTTSVDRHDVQEDLCIYFGHLSGGNASGAFYCSLSGSDSGVRKGTFQFKLLSDPDRP